MRLVCRCPFKVRREAQRLPTHIHATRTHRRPLVLVPQCVSRTTRTNRWRPRVKQRLSFPRLPPVPVDSSRCICVPMAHSVDPTHVVGIWVGRRRTMSAGRAQRLPSTDKLSQSKQLQISVAIFASAQRHNVGARSVGPMRNANGRRTYICAIGGRARWHAHLSGSTEHDQERTIVRSGTTGRAGIARVPAALLCSSRPSAACCEGGGGEHGGEGGQTKCPEGVCGGTAAADGRRPLGAMGTRAST